MPTNMMPIPDWVDSEAEPIRGLDLLGLRLPAQAIGNILLSGITTISPTTRYLSIRAWIIRTFELSGLPATWKAIEDFAASIESAVVLGNLLVNPHMPGLVGPDRAHPLVESGTDPLPLGRLVVQLAFNTYAGPSEALGLSLTLPSGLPALTSERGKPLADEFEKSVQGTRFRAALAGGPLPESVSRDVLREFGERVRVDAIPPGESALLLNAIMPADPGIVAGANERNRIATYVVLLELADSLKREPQDSDFCNKSAV